MGQILERVNLSTRQIHVVVFQSNSLLTCVTLTLDLFKARHRSSQTKRLKSNTTITCLFRYFLQELEACKGRFLDIGSCFLKWVSTENIEV